MINCHVQNTASQVKERSNDKFIAFLLTHNLSGKGKDARGKQI